MFFYRMEDAFAYEDQQRRIEPNIILHTFVRPDGFETLSASEGYTYSNNHPAYVAKELFDTEGGD